MRILAKYSRFFKKKKESGNWPYNSLKWSGNTRRQCQDWQFIEFVNICYFLFFLEYWDMHIKIGCSFTSR